ncbi:hypothetical protein KAR91_85760 [Candidatus Pacearchaeota archaeon]|nr:hypothetical protein [Candidatus Pacearchaeota archaeon]
MRDLELKFQDRVVRELKSDVNLTQKFTDMFSLGIPDLLTGNRDAAMWVELKWCEIPKRPDTPFDLAHFTGPQKNWLTRWDMKPNMCLCLVGTQRGWFVITPNIFATPHTKASVKFTTGPITFLGLYKEYLTGKSL